MKLKSRPLHHFRMQWSAFVFCIFSFWRTYVTIYLCYQNTVGGCPLRRVCGPRFADIYIFIEIYKEEGGTDEYTGSSCSAGFWAWMH